MLRVCKMEGVVHDTLIEHGVEHHLPYVVCMENGGKCVLEHGVMRRLSYVVRVENVRCGA